MHQIPRQTIYIFIALAGYMIPWIVTPSNPLSLNAYDLAEWASLHPSQPNTSPPLIVPLFLRVQLVFIALLIATNVTTISERLVSLIAIGLLAVAQLPPLEFLTIATDNINYQQQFILASITLIVGGGGIFLRLNRIRPVITIILCLIGIITAYTGLQQAQSLYTMSLQEFTTGSGIFLTASAYIALLLIALFASDGVIRARLMQQTT